ncbi:trafficking protein particle complex subunit 11 [Anaeramoeba flamelloides]|uniref:Trafficking protein particle complex subunit 11 n=1 Tax=Anaeramoeba flamelloides TaxID=1746091 RepID=A0ABQ8YB42_9EUKA|nr:trafficking protein particle complex subunit 11 [Anaeramoeba flamelloides]
MNTYHDDLISQPTPLIGLIGEESQKSLLKDSSFENYKFLSFENLSKLPKKKNNIKQFSESYQPEGLLKTNWIQKQLHQIPSSFIKFFVADDLFNQENVVVSHISTLFRALKERNIKIIFIIIVPLESTIAKEQFENQILTIKQKTQFDTRQGTFVFWYESTPKESKEAVLLNFKESINRYLKERIRKVKKNRDFYMKKKQASIFVRLYFKCGFYSEMQGEYKASLKYYLRSYKFLSNISIRRTSPTELRAVSEVINLKILFQYLKLNQYSNAVDQFQEHISFGNSIPLEGKDYKFLTFVWISQQYKMFANYLELIPIEKLSPIKNCYENIGFYYNSAANYSIERKTIIQTLKKKFKKKLSKLNVKMFQPATVYERIYDFSNCNYVGQPNWVLTLDDPLQVVSKQTEDDDYFRELYSEIQFDHSTEILDLLRKAYRNYSEQKPHCERLITTIATKIAKEYFEEGEFKFAKKFIDHISEKFRQDKWYKELSTVLLYSLECGLQLKNWRDFVKCLLELLVPKLNIQEETKCILQSKLISIISDSEKEKQKLKPHEIINMNPQFPISPLILFKAHFTQFQVKLNENIYLKLSFESNFPKSITFKKLYLDFNISSYNRMVVFSKDDQTQEEGDKKETGEEKEKGNTQEFEDQNKNENKDSIENDNESNLIFHPNKKSFFQFQFKASHIGKLKIRTIKLLLGDEEEGIYFIWNPFEFNNNSTLNNTNGIHHYNDYKKEMNFPNRSTIEILRPRKELNLKIESQQTAFVGELFQINLILETNSDHLMNSELVFEKTKKMKLYSMDQLNGLNETNETNETNKTNEMIDNKGLNEIKSIYNIKIMETKPQSEKKIIIFVKSEHEGIFDLNIKLKYLHKLGYKGIFVENYSINFTHPFEHNFNFYSLSKEILNKGALYLLNKQNFILSSEIIMQTKSHLILKEISLLLNDGFGEIIGKSFEKINSDINIPVENNNGDGNGNSNGNGNGNDDNKCLSEDENVNLKPNEIHQTCFYLKPNSVLQLNENKNQQKKKIRNKRNKRKAKKQIKYEKEVNIGSIILKYQRNNFNAKKENDKQFLITKKITIPKVNFVKKVLTVDIDFPSQGRVGEQMVCKYLIHNHSDRFQKIMVHVSHSEEFLFSGFVDTTFQILPRATRKLNYNLIPIITGTLSLPSVKIFDTNSNYELTETKKKFHIFILPSKKK